jgi:hypothetical protein
MLIKMGILFMGAKRKQAIRRGLVSAGIEVTDLARNKDRQLKVCASRVRRLIQNGES